MIPQRPRRKTFREWQHALSQLHDAWKCADRVERHERRKGGGFRFSWVLRARPDLAYGSDWPPLDDWDETVVHTAWQGGGQGGWCWWWWWRVTLFAMKKKVGWASI